MPIETPTSAIHATAVAIGDRGLVDRSLMDRDLMDRDLMDRDLMIRALVIRGPSKAGKSTLALDLIAASRPDRPIMLIGDDRLLVSRRDGIVRVAPHPRIAGLIEKRGEGILAMPYCRDVPVYAVVDLDPPSGATSCDIGGQNFPSLQFVIQERDLGRAACVLKWLAATSVAQSVSNCGSNGRSA